MAKTKILIGLNLEYSRHDDKPFPWAVSQAAKIGYKYIEPMVHWGHELMSLAGYYHTVSMFDDPREVAELCAKHKVKCSAISAHCPVVQPDIGVRTASAGRTDQSGPRTALPADHRAAPRAIPPGARRTDRT